MTSFILRPWQRADIEAVAEAADNPNIAANLRNIFPSPYTLADAKWFVEDSIAQGETRQLMRAIAVNGRAAGSISVARKDDVYEKSAELGYWLAEDYWGRRQCGRFAGKPLTALTSSAFSQSPLRKTWAPAGCWKRRASSARAQCAWASIKTGGYNPTACTPSCGRN